MTTPRRGIRSSPVLRVADVPAAVAYYAEILGFEVGGIWGEPPCFAIVGLGTVTVMLDAGEKPGRDPVPVNQGWAAYIYIDDANTYFAEVNGRGAHIAREPEDAFYGCRDFDVRDLDGHLLAFGQDLQPGPEGPGL